MTNELIGKMFKKILDLQNWLFYYKQRYYFEKWKSNLMETYIRENLKGEIKVGFYAWVKKTKGYDYFEERSKRSDECMQTNSNWLDGEKKPINFEAKEMED